MLFFDYSLCDCPPQASWGMIPSMETNITGSPDSHRPVYRTLTSPSQVRLEARRSIFIGLAAPAADEGVALALLADARKQYSDASHHVSAWVIGGETRLQRYSDDGEPQGTAGLPVLDVLRRQQLEDAVVVVVRYFGGYSGNRRTGPRLSRTAAWQSGIAAVEMTLSDTFRITVAYTDYDRSVTGRTGGFLLRSPLLDGCRSTGLVKAGQGHRLETTIDGLYRGAAHPARTAEYGRPES
jgi:putative IMPACT (imprinted ancient) family translation regulator